MSAKPGTVPRWANVGGSIVTPSAGKQDVGNVNGERPPAGYENWLKNLYYQWLQYLSDGNLTGAHTFGSTVGITGLLTATAGVTCGANTHVTISGTGLFKHGTKTLQLSACAFLPDGASTYTRSLGAITNTSGAMTLEASIPLPTGARILAVRLLMKDSVTGPTKLTVSLWSNTSNNAGSQVGVSAASAGNATAQTLSLSGLTTVMAATTNYIVAVATSTGTAPCFVYGAEVDYDQP